MKRPFPARHALLAPLLGAALLLLLVHTALAQGQNPSFNLLNHGRAAIREVYVTPAGDARWGQNRLNGAIIAPGGSFAVRRHIDNNCIFDIRVVFADGRTEDRRNLNTCTLDDVAFGAPPGPAAGNAPSSKPAGDPSFRLINRAGQAIAQAFATPAGSGNWGQDRLDGAPLPPQTDRIVHVDRTGGCRFDLRIVFSDHTAKEKHNTDLCRITDLPVP